jgi:Fe-S-cluster containining protein
MDEVPDKEDLACLQCGHCCGPYFSLYVDEADEKRWEAEGRKDLLERLDWERWRVGWDEAGAYNMETGERFEKCVFRNLLPDGRVLCGIHETKPLICRDFPPGGSSLCVLFKKSPTSPETA